MATKKAVGTDKSGATFEQSLQRLEAIVREMESGSLSLDTMIQRFEEGQVLIGVCNRKLNEVERKIEMLVKKDGEEKIVPFDGGDAGAGDGSGGISDEGKSSGDRSDGVPF